MTTVMFALILAVVAWQGPKLTSVQAGTITRAVADHLVPHSGDIGDGPLNYRPMVFDQEATIRAFRPFLTRVDKKDFMLTLPALLRTRSAAIICDKARDTCTIDHGGVYIAIDAVDTRGVREGEYHITASVRWADKAPDGRSRLGGADYDLVVGLVGAKWKHWEVLREHRTPVK
jgi:hypothetical protein